MSEYRLEVAVLVGGRSFYRESLGKRRRPHQPYVPG